MRRRSLLLAAATAASAVPQTRAPSDARQRAVEAERGFASSMARRDLAAFTSFLSEEAVFLSAAGTEKPPQRGKRAITDAWKKFFEGPTPPFSWDPDVIEVLDSGKLALTSGPVLNPQGELTGRFTSIWRLEDDGKWRVVFDRGCQVCR